MGKKVAMVILDQFADWEGAYISNALKSGEITKENDVLWVSNDREHKRSIGGMTVLPDLAIHELPEDIDALILIGGNSWRSKDALEVVPVVQKFIKSEKPVGFICDATYFAADHGFLNHVAHTGNSADDLSMALGYTNRDNFQWEDVVTDGRIITANGNSPIEFAQHILKVLDVASEEDITMWYDFYTMGYVKALKKYGYLDP